MLLDMAIPFCYYALLHPSIPDNQGRYNMPEFVPISKSRSRYTFGRAHDVIEMPDMIQV